MGVPCLLQQGRCQAGKPQGRPEESLAKGGWHATRGKRGALGLPSEQHLRHTAGSASPEPEAASQPAPPPALVEDGGQEAALAHALQLEAVAAHLRLRVGEAGEGAVQQTGLKEYKEGLHVTDTRLSTTVGCDGAHCHLGCSQKGRQHSSDGVVLRPACPSSVDTIRCHALALPLMPAVPHLKLPNLADGGGHHDPPGQPLAADLRKPHVCVQLRSRMGDAQAPAREAATDLAFLVSPPAHGRAARARCTSPSFFPLPCKNHAIQPGPGPSCSPDPPTCCPTTAR